MNHGVVLHAAVRSGTNGKVQNGKEKTNGEASKAVASLRNALRQTTRMRGGSPLRRAYEELSHCQWQLGISLLRKENFQSYQKLASKTYAQLSHWTAAIAFLAGLQGLQWQAWVSEGVRASPAPAQFACEACNTAGQWKWSTRLLASIPKEYLGRRTQEATADSIAAADLWEDALAFLGMLHQVGVQGFPATSLLSSCGRAELWELSLDLFNSRRQLALGDLHSSFMRQAIYECCRGRSWSHALQLLSDIRGSRVKPNLGVFDFVIATCYRSGRWRNGLQVFGQVLREGHVPSHRTCAAGLDSCEAGGHWKLGTQLLDQMASCWLLRPHKAAFNPVLEACQKSAAWSASLVFLRLMDKTAVAPDVFSYSAATRAVLKSRQMRLALGLVAEMAQQRLDLGVAGPIIFTATFRSCNWIEALQRLQAFQSFGLRRDLPLLGAAAQRLRSSWARALQLATAPDLGLDTAGLNQALGTCAAADHWQLASSLLSSSLQSKVRLDHITVSSYMGLVPKASRGRAQRVSAPWPRAMLAFQQSRGCLGSHRLSHYAALSTCKKGLLWGIALDVLEAMPAQQLRPDMSSWNAVLQSCKRDSWAWVFDLSERMLLHSMKPDVVTCDTQVGAFGTRTTWRSAVDLLFSRMSPKKLDKPLLCYCCQVLTQAHQRELSAKIKSEYSLEHPVGKGRGRTRMRRKEPQSCPVQGETGRFEGLRETRR
ncbi:unnamed protein product [Effrenium voratum]|nr:unnamed protein product [Effrenium voratum]